MKYVATIVAGLVMAIAMAGPASAHDVLLAMTPADGSTTASLPRSVSLRFDAAVGTAGSTVVVTDPTGTRVDDVHPKVQDDTVTVGIVQPTDTAQPVGGDYRVDYRIVSADGHVVSNSLGFTVSGPGAPTAAAAAPAPRSDGGGSPTPWIITGLVALALVYLAYDLTRRRRSRPARTEGPST